MAENVLNMPEELDSICKGLSRHLNCLLNENKNTRKRAIEAIKKETVKKEPRPNPVVLNGVLHELIRPLLGLFSDSVANCRELTISVVTEMVLQVSDPQEFLQFIIPTLVQRLGQPQIVETMEEIRLQLVELVQKLIEITGKKISPYLDDLVKILQRTIVDPFAEVKRESCNCAAVLAKSIPEHFHVQSESLINPLLQTISHQHSKVRVAAIKSIGDVIQYGNGKSVDDVVSHLAQRLFDSTPLVRLSVTQVVGGWLLDLMDRYSFHHKLIPLLLTSLTDEFPDIRSEADTLWQDVGEKYASENDKDLKDKLDFPKPNRDHYPVGIERPNFGCRTLMYHNFSKILSGLTRDLADWVPGTRIKSVQLLYTLLLNEEENVTQHLEKVLTGLNKASNDEEKIVQDYVFKSARLLGYFVVPEVWCKMVLENVKLTQSPGSLSLLAEIIRGSERERLRPYLADIANIITDPSISRLALRSVQQSVLSVVDAIIEVAKEDCGSISLNLFDIIISVMALDRQDELQQWGQTLLDQLASAQMMSAGKEELFKKHLKEMLDSFDDSYRSWVQHSCELFIFSTLLIHAGRVVDDVLDDVVKILLANLDPLKDAEVRGKVFKLLSHLIINSSNRSDGAHRFGDFVIIVVRDMILPNCVWKAGRTAEVIRKMAVSCLKVLLSRKDLVTVDQVLLMSDGILTRLQTTLDDDNAGTRLVTCQLFTEIFDLVGHEIRADHRIYNMYPDLLKRLDDGSDDVRIAATRTFAAYFECLREKYDVAMYRAHLVEIYKGLLIHLDDQNEQIQQAVLETLKISARVLPDVLLKEVDAIRHKHRNTVYCDQLVQFIHSLPKPE